MRFFFALKSNWFICVYIHLRIYCDSIDFHTLCIRRINAKKIYKTRLSFSFILVKWKIALVNVHRSVLFFVNVWAVWWPNINIPYQISHFIVMNVTMLYNLIHRFIGNLKINFQFNHALIKRTQYQSSEMSLKEKFE